MKFIIDNIFPITIALLSGVMLFWSAFGNRIRGIKEVGPTAALQLINHKNAMVLDVREADEYKAGHVLGAMPMPLGKLKDRIGELEKYRDMPIVVVCRSGIRSASACVTLGKQGFSQAHNLAGGIAAWQKSNLPLEQ